jgi:hypothetical protein
MAMKETMVDAMLVVSVQGKNAVKRIPHHDATCPDRSPGDGVEVKRYAEKND